MRDLVKKFFAAVTVLGCTMACSSLSVFAADGESSPTAAGEQQPGGFNWMSILLMVGYILFFVVIGYFLIFRPNKKRKQEEEKMRNSLTLGTQVVTIGGICGTIVNIKDDTLTIESSLDRTLIEIKNWAIREVKKLETDDEPDNAATK